MTTAYCMKFGKKVDVKKPMQMTMKNGWPAGQGECLGYGTKVFKIGKA